jgi:hypothetical protein
LSYNQGLYVVALMAAKELGLGVDSREVTTALARYRDLANGHDGYLRFSRGLNYHDISGLVGDFLGLWLFHTPMLSTAVVDATLRSQPSFASGFKVVTDGHGRPLPHSAFVQHFFPGDYQNGGSWLLFDYLALADGYLRGIPDMGDRMAERLHTEFQHRVTFHEYLNTNPHSPLFQHEPVYRDTFSWDTFVLRIDAIVSRLPCRPGIHSFVLKDAPRPGKVRAGNGYQQAVASQNAAHEQGMPRQHDQTIVELIA